MGDAGSVDCLSRRRHKSSNRPLSPRMKTSLSRLQGGGKHYFASAQVEAAVKAGKQLLLCRRGSVAPGP
jgi:hypothetical protein